MSLDPRLVYVVRTPAGYDEAPPVNAPELPVDAHHTASLSAVRELLRSTGLDARRFSTNMWNPLGELIDSHDRVLIKPNWVHHENASEAGLDCLVTHSTLVDALLEYVILAKPDSIIVGDAPIQSCDFRRLHERTGLDVIFARARGRRVPIHVRDFRLVKMDGRRSGAARQTERSLDGYVLFDLGFTSFLEPVSGRSPAFRVTMYDPQALEMTHGPGRHQYLIAREVLEANVVINLPKLKTHKKSCLTGALKNMVGINGHKSYLPHHRKGGSEDGGDCYAGHAAWKSFTEDLLDRGNRSSLGMARRLCKAAAAASMRAAKATAKGAPFDLEGSWHGNDTIWRTVLDLQHILHYGRADGSIASSPQRRVINLTDAIVGGEGEGPLAPTPANMQFLTFGMSAPATDWVNAILIGLDPKKIPLTRAAFSSHLPVLAEFQPEHITVRLDGNNLNLKELEQEADFRAIPPSGWVGHCEAETLQEAAQ